MQRGQRGEREGEMGPLAGAPQGDDGRAVVLAIIPSFRH